ncbi:MAG: hypothetical protein JHC87_04345, partial [Thermoleophilaceae bacterium]|nr:hypothetical protein [Thermoleophilaceae bacterium]
MVQVHITVGIALFVLNLGAGAWGVTAWLAKRPSPGFWYLLRAAQAAVVAQAILGGLLIATNHRSSDDLHYLYGILPLGIMLMTEAMRVGAAQHAVGDIDYTDIPEED